MSKKIKLSSLIQDDKNNNKHTAYGMDLLEKSVNKVGIIESITVSNDDKIISGNARHEVIGKNFNKEAIVIETDGTQPIIIKRTDIESDTKQFYEASILANTTSKKNIDFDMEVIDSLAVEYDIDVVDLGVDIVNEEILEAEEDDFNGVAPKEPITVLGDLYEIGEHRLLCGDSTDSDQVAKLMNGEKADMVFTDPPYGVEIKGKFTGTILNDNLQGDEFDDFLTACFNNLKLFNQGNLYISYEIKNHTTFEKALINSGFNFDEIIIWNKDSASFYSNNKYNRKFEPIFFIENGKELKCKPDVNVWDFAKSSSFASRDENNKRFNENGNFLVAHPTTKPLGLIQKPLNNSTKENDLILDLFLGSGSTMVASHQLKRKCYGMELDCRYADVIVKRMLKLDKTLKIKKNGIDETETWLKLIE